MTTDHAPRDTSVTALDDDLVAALRHFAALPKILVCLDFDGCVAELVPDADDARPVPANAEAVRRLSEFDGVRVAYVSGRGLDTLREIAAPPSGTLLIGSHGAERDVADLAEEDAQLVLTSEQEAARTRLLEVFETIAAQTDGAWVEHKPAGAAMHVRKVPDAAEAEHVLTEARAAVAALDEVHPKEGKAVLEAVVVQATKGEGITELRELVSPDAVFFAGDDVTDEFGFAVLAGADVGVKVGEGETRADHRIGAPPQLADVLTVIADARERAGAAGAPAAEKEQQ
ncbi:trehalose-phosphatase [Nesterenkonia sp. CL21]|uniref:trehalose-phosphatase n=1 Tax=Nesterenkonia sp. CL21 TaxID=3064894 RepID=UPI00287A36BE|nr:trehalose-phosphatase [Nesterenkonia sp. CL21]MDS2172349.1 trehalose-phosphatase [Nesterenkonia sp. CL21]